MKVAINTCFGGFSLSGAIINRLIELTGDESLWERERQRTIARHDPNLIKVIEEMGGVVNWGTSQIQIIEIPDGVDYEVEDYDGSEWISEKHRTWGRDL